MLVRGRGALLPATLIVLLAVAACEEPLPPEASGPPERIVLITIDTLRADRLGSYGRFAAGTPNLDRLAARGVRFEQAIAPTPLTQPSHATLFTAVAPTRHGVRNNGNYQVPDELPTLAERLRDQGYATAGFVGAVVLEAHYGFARGFDHFDDRMERAGEARGLDARRADAVVDAALDWLETAPPRFFLWIHVYDPHAPYDAPGLLRNWRARSAYDAEVAFVDAELGRLFEALRVRFSDAKTLFVVTSDHGESLGEHGELTHGYSLYDATQRVPLILAGPGLPRGRSVPALARLSDLAPTLLALTGAEPLPDPDGADLRPLWAGEAAPERSALLETLAPQLHFGWSPLLGLRTPRWKYVRAPRPELYDLAADPRETRDLAAAHPERVSELDAELEARLGEAHAPTATPLDPLRRAQLERLGYVVASRDVAPDRLGRVGGPDPKDHMRDLFAFREATNLLRKGRPQQALDVLSGLSDEFPYVANVRADAALAIGDPAAAERHARAALRGAGDDYYLWVTLGNALLHQNRLDDAEQAYARGAELHPAAPEPLLGLGLVAEGRGRHKRAEAFYRRALETRIVSTEAYWLLAALEIEQGDDRAADALLAELHEEVREAPMAAARLAQAEARAGRRDAALARLARAQERHPTSPVLERARVFVERIGQARRRRAPDPADAQERR